MTQKTIKTRPKKDHKLSTVKIFEILKKVWSKNKKYLIKIFKKNTKSKSKINQNN